MKYVILERETMRESIISDCFTGVMLVFCIWFSNENGGGFWTLATFLMFVVWLSVKLPMESERVKKVKTKQEAQEWANGLADE